MAEEPVSETTKTSHPPAIWFFFWGEFAERSSYYGMRAILFLYMTQVLHLADTKAGPMYSAFKMACYFLPLLGGYIADRWLGRYWTIVGFSVPYVIGQFLLRTPDYTTMVIALALLAGGSGVIKPNISTLMGQTYDQKRPGNDQLRISAFNWFYLSINIGALISMFCLPLARNHYVREHLDETVRATALAAERNGEDITKFASQEVLEGAYAFAFAFPAGLMILALVVFALGKPFYAKETIEPHVLTPEERSLQWKTLVRLFGIFLLVVLFWFGYEHNDTLWVAFNRDYVNRRLPFDLPVIGQTVSADQLQFINSLFVIILIPVFNVMYARLDPEIKIFTSMRKVLAGFILTAAAIGIMSLAGFLAQGHTQQVADSGKMVEISSVKVSILFPVIAYIVLTVGEVLLYGTMLELAYSAAPKSMKGFVTACFLVTNTLGNLMNMVWMKTYAGSLVDPVTDRGWEVPAWLPGAGTRISILPGQFFGITALVVLFAAVVFIYVGKRFEKSQAEAAAAGLT